MIDRPPRRPPKPNCADELHLDELLFAASILYDPVPSAKQAATHPASVMCTHRRDVEEFYANYYAGRESLRVCTSPYVLALLFDNAKLAARWLRPEDVVDRLIEEYGDDEMQYIHIERRPYDIVRIRIVNPELLDRVDADGELAPPAKGEEEPEEFAELFLKQVFQVMVSEIDFYDRRQRGPLATLA